MKDNNNWQQIAQKDVEYQKEPRWPVEMQVLPDKITHIMTLPNEPEPFYIKSKI